MAQAKKISELAQAGTITGLELAVVVQDGETRQATTEQIAASVSQRLAVFEASTSTAFESLYVLTSLNAVSIAAAEAQVSALTVLITSLDVSAVNERLDEVSSAISVNTLAVASINTRVDTVSALTSVNKAAITSVNSVVGALEIRVSAVSALAATNAAAITSINAEVSLKAYRSGDYLTNARYIEFDTSASNGNAVPGKLIWNSNDGTLDIGLYGDSILQVGQETVYYLKNGEASTISNGQLVMATSVVGNSGKLIGGLADGSGTTPAEYLLGVATQSIAAGEFGYVTQFGLVRGINATGSQYSETWASGDLLYANASILGGLTNSPPAYPAFSIPLAIVVNAVSNSGSIFVRMKSGEYLESLHDVDISTKVGGDVISWNSSIGGWVNSQVLVETQASLSALAAEVSTLSIQVNALDVSAVNSRLDAVSALVSGNAAAITSINNAVSALEIRVSAVSAVASSNSAAIVSTNAVVSALQIQVNNLDVSAVNVRLDAVSAVAASAAADVSVLTILVNNLDVSAVNARLDTVSAATSVNSAAITSVNAVTSALTIQVADVSALVSANAAAIAAVSAVTSALQIQVDAVSALTSVNAAAVSTLQLQVNTVSAAVSTLQIQVNSVSALTSVNAAAITSINSQVTFAGKTFTSATFNDGFTEEVFAITDGSTVNLDPNNGSIQTWALGASRTPGEANWSAGQSITLLVDDGSAYTITWTTLAVTWKTDAGSAPTLNTSGFTVIVLWKVGSTIYGARVGDA